MKAHAGVLEPFALTTWRTVAPALASQPALQAVEDRPIGFAESGASASQGLLEKPLVFGRSATGVDIGAVYRVMHDQFLQGATDRPQGQVASHQVIAGYL